MDAHELFNKNIGLAYWACEKVGPISGMSKDEKLSYAMETLFTCCKYWVPEKSKLGNYYYASFVKLIRGSRCIELSKKWRFNSRMHSLDLVLENTPESWCDNPVAFEEPDEGEMTEVVNTFRIMRDRFGSSLQKLVALRHNNGESYTKIAESVGCSKQNVCVALQKLAGKLKRMHTGESRNKIKLSRAHRRRKLKSYISKS